MRKAGEAARSLDKAYCNGAAARPCCFTAQAYTSNCFFGGWRSLGEPRTALTLGTSQVHETLHVCTSQRPERHHKKQCINSDTITKTSIHSVPKTYAHIRGDTANKRDRASLGNAVENWVHIWVHISCPSSDRHVNGRRMYLGANLVWPAAG